MTLFLNWLGQSLHFVPVHLKWHIPGMKIVIYMCQMEGRLCSPWVCIYIFIHWQTEMTSLSVFLMEVKRNSRVKSSLVCFLLPLLMDWSHKKLSLIKILPLPLAQRHLFSDDVFSRADKLSLTSNQFPMYKIKLHPTFFLVREGPGLRFFFWEGMNERWKFRVLKPAALVFI